jgi:transcriptional regulator NrdR family protein
MVNFGPGFCVYLFKPFYRLNMEKIWVKKHDGSRQEFSQEKVVNSLLRSGIPRQNIPSILSEIEARLYPGISTSEIYDLLHQLLQQKESISDAHYFRLREGLTKIDSYNFEQLVAEILTTQGYECQWNVMAPGHCIEHQVDVVAKKGEQLIFTEVKHHTTQHRDTGLGDIVETWGRLMDISECSDPKKIAFNKACLLTNTKFSEHAKRFAACRGVMLFGWRYNTLLPERKQDEGLEKMLEEMGRDKVVKLIEKVV